MYSIAAVDTISVVSLLEAVSASDRASSLQLRWGSDDVARSSSMLEAYSILNAPFSIMVMAAFKSRLLRGQVS